MKKLIKKLLILTVILAMVVTAMPFTETVFKDLLSYKVFAIDEEDEEESNYFDYGDYYCHKEEDNSVTILKYKGSTAEIVIPSEINGYPVVYINQYAFSPSSYTNDYGVSIEENPGCKNIISVTIPSTVKELGRRVFYKCENLENIVFSEGLECIAEGAFKQCEKLSYIDLPSTLEIIEEDAFAQTAIEELIIKDNPDSPFYMGQGMFYDSAIKKVIVKRNDVDLFHNVFTKSSVEEVIFEGSVEEFHNKALPNKDNTVKSIVFKASFPPETIELLTTTFGYYYHENHEDGSIRFDKTASNSGYTDIIFVPGMGEYVLNENSDAIVTKYTGYESEIFIPEEINGHKIVEIADGAFANYNVVSPETGETVYIEKVSIPSTVKKIGVSSFEGNTKLTEIEILGAEEIGFAAFKGCTALATADISSTVKYIEAYAFNGCSALTAFTAKGVERIGIMAFKDCKKLSEVTLSESMSDIGASAFINCTALKTFVIPEGIKILKEKIFSGCKNLSKVTLPSTVEAVEGYVFENCTNLKMVENTKYITKLSPFSFYSCGINFFDFSPDIKEIPGYCFSKTGFVDLVIPSTVETVSKNAFSHLTSLDNLVISEGVKNLEYGAFSQSGGYTLTLPSNLEVIQPHVFSYATIDNLVIPEGVKHLMSYAFHSCKIKNLTIPESLEVLEYGAFDYATVSTLNFNAIRCETYGSTFSQTINHLGIRGVSKLNIGDNVEIIPGYLCEESNIRELVIPEGVKKIGYGAFRDTFESYLTSVTLPSTVEVIEGYAFYNAKNLKEFTIPESVTEFSANAINGCSGIETVYINAINCEFTDLTVASNKIEQSPFYDNYYFKNLKKIVLGDKVKQIPNNLLSCITREIECVIPETVKDIGDYAFYSYRKLTEFNFHEGLESIGEYSFANCVDLTSVELPETLKIIDNFAFLNCQSIESITLPDSVIYLGEGVFTDCSGLKSFVFGDAVNTVPAGLFEGCESLENVYVSDSVVRIDERAFYQCKSLKSVRMSSNVDYIPREAFYYCSALTEFTWDAESKLIGRLAFAYCNQLVNFDFINVEKLYVNSFLNSGVNVVQLGENENEETRTPLTTVEVQSFMDCENLETVGIGGNVTTIKKQAFADCTNLEIAVIADSVTEIADDAFDGCDKLTIYCSENSYAHTYAQTQGIRVSTLVIAPIPNQTYTGFEIKPEISVSASGDTLDKNIDFSVSYANNINVGNADVTVKGKGDFRMFASKAKFTIVTKNISAVTVSPIADQPYTGSAITPDLTVTDGLKVLSEGKDYTVTFSNNVNEGTATAKITGIGNYSGTATTNFQISKEAEEPAEPSFFEKVFSAVISFFARIIAFLISIFM